MVVFIFFSNMDKNSEALQKFLALRHSYEDVLTYNREDIEKDRITLTSFVYKFDIESFLNKKVDYKQQSQLSIQLLQKNVVKLDINFIFIIKLSVDRAFISKNIKNKICHLLIALHFPLVSLLIIQYLTHKLRTSCIVIKKDFLLIKDLQVEMKVIKLKDFHYNRSRLLKTYPKKLKLTV